MKQILFATIALSALVSGAQAQLFGSGSFVITTQNSPSSGTNNVLFQPGTTNLDGGAVQVTINIVNDASFATTGAQWAVFTYNTPNLAALSSSGQNWSIEQISIPLSVNADFIGDYTQWNVAGDAVNQVAPIFGQTLMNSPVPGLTGNGEGTLGFKDPISAGPAPQLGAFADPFQLVITGLGGVVPGGFTQALEFAPASFVPPGDGDGGGGGAVPEASTWAMLGIGFGLMAMFGIRRRKDRLASI